ncbi:TPA: LamG domain-containing protein, partial [bacterium]|nr:LamG domain-containing protein [bacterium]
SQWKGADAQTKITDERWHHIAGSYDLENLRIYVDGKMEKESKYKGPPDPVDQPMTFGDMENFHPILGVLDEVGIFNKALSANEIVSIMDKGLDLSINPVLTNGKLTTTWSKIKAK